MKNKIILLILSAILILSALTSCTYIPKVSYDTVTRITLEAGASVELIVNRENNVVVVTPLNDEASVLLVNENLLKIAPDKAVDKIMELALKSGFDRNTVRLSISGESDYVDVITDMITKKIEKKLKKFKVDATVELVEPATAEELRRIFIDGKFYTEDEMSLTGDGDLIYYLALCRKETAFLPSLTLKKLYYLSRECSMEIYTREGKLGVLETIKEEFPDVYATYVEAFNSLKTSALALEDAAKELYLADTYNESASESALESYYSDFEAQKTAILTLENTFPKEVKVAIGKAFYNTQTEIVNKRNKFPHIFNEKYQSDIDAAKNKLVAKKNELIK